jgi:hypothetical protein
MMMPDHDNDIEELFCLLDHVIGGKPHRAALTALVAERDALKQENDALRSRCKVHQDEVLDRVFEMDALRKRVAELEAHPPADRDRELRERLVCAALTGIIGDVSSYEDAADAAVRHADATLAAMRKEGGGA